jgi:hypothetical protein
LAGRDAEPIKKIDVTAAPGAERFYPTIGQAVPAYVVSQGVDWVTRRTPFPPGSDESA